MVAVVVVFLCRPLRPALSMALSQELPLLLPTLSEAANGSVLLLPESLSVNKGDSLTVPFQDQRRSNHCRL